jgi:hypothetical protein
MLKIENSVLSFDILETKFFCNIKKCKGACCVLGDSGAPLEDHEVEILKQIFPSIKPYMSNKGINAVEMLGTSVVDKDGDQVTPLINNKECAYVIFESGIAKCAIEKAYELKAISYQKPVSCHLYPIRITKYKDFEALNYHEWNICKPALVLGNKKNIPLNKFLANPLIRKYGEQWVEKLEIASQEVLKYLKKKE